MRTTFTLLLTTILGLCLSTNLLAQENGTTNHLSKGPDAITGLSIRTGEGKVFLEWSVTSNAETEIFEVETSRDGRDFSLAAVVFASEKQGMEDYRFYEKASKRVTNYRVKVIQKNGSISYSPVMTTASKQDRSHL